MNPQNEAQIELEKLYHKNQLLPRLRQELHNEVVVTCCLENNLPIDFIVDLMAQTYLHKRAEVGTLVGLLHRHFGTGEGEPEAAWLMEEQRENCHNAILARAEITQPSANKF